MYLIFNKKSIAAVLSAVILFAAVIVSGSGIRYALSVPASSSVSWGLSFPPEGGTPKGNLPAEELKKYNAFYVGDTNKKQLYLTFDAGYENGFTPAILKTLKDHGVKATFFLVGNYIRTEPELVRQMIKDGHTVGNHTYSHPDMSAISDPEAFRKELCELEDAFEEVTGKKPDRLYRPPQGKFSTGNLEAAEKNGYKTIFWSLAYADWDNNDQPDEEAAISKLLERTHNGAVILLHSTSRTNSLILDRLLTRWEEEGYTFGDLNELGGG